jgi:dipeptidyl aminopeptidase/acylaminoacyl peptidase
MKSIVKLISVSLILLHTAVFAETLPLEVFAERDSMRNVQLSPDGNKLALLRIPERGANPILEIYETADLSKEPFRMNADPMEITTYGWIGNNDIVIGFRQQVRDQIRGFNRGVYESVLGKLDLDRQKVRRFKETNLNIANLLVDKPDKILVSLQPSDMTGLNPRFRPFSYYEFDLNTERKKLVLRGRPNIGGVRFDKDGNPRLAFQFERGSSDITVVMREPGDSDWTPIYTNKATSYEDFTVNGMDPDNEDRMIVTAHNGRDKEAIWTFDYKNKKFDELIFAHPFVDAGGTVTHSNPWQYPNKIVGVRYTTDRRYVEYFDGQEKALNEQLRTLIPNAHDVSISGRSKDGKTFLITNVGPKDPRSYYLIHNGKLAKIGSSKAEIKPEHLSRVEFVEYKGRDGATLYAYVTIPDGKGPFPAVVVPHGGPFVSEYISYDEWGQMLANNGYLVIQPQYRGSRGFGLKYWQEAFLPSGQGGYKMQDDKDDAVKHLVKEGLVDEDRVAMFGWSYGGYAALIAASREDQIYQCAIAGAAVSDNDLQRGYFERLFGPGAEKTTGYISLMNMWTDSISPIDVVEKVNIPLLMIHGDVDQRVPIDNAEVYLDAAKKTGTRVDYVELEGADHFSNTLFYHHKIKLYNSIINFLGNSCNMSA